MMTMILNGKTNEPIDISSYSRTLDVPNPDVRFSLDISFNGNYSAAGVEYLADYADINITSIKIKNGNDDMLDSSNITAKLNSLNETCNENGERYGYASIIIYEANANSTSANN